MSTDELSELGRGAAVEAVRAALRPEDRAEFDRSYSEATDSEVLKELVESWRRVAVLHADAPRFARVVRRAAELRTGAPVPEDEPFPVTRFKAGM